MEKGIPKPDFALQMTRAIIARTQTANEEIAALKKAGRFADAAQRNAQWHEEIYHFCAETLKAMQHTIDTLMQEAIERAAVEPAPVFLPKPGA